MRADALAFGAMVFVAGIGGAVWAMDQADRYSRYSSEYESLNWLTLGCFALAALGAAVALYVAASSPQQTVQRAYVPIAKPSSNQATYCAYCGNPLQGAIVCRVCGRSVQK